MSNPSNDETNAQKQGSQEQKQDSNNTGEKQAEKKTYSEAEFQYLNRQLKKATDSIASFEAAEKKRQESEMSEAQKYKSQLTEMEQKNKELQQQLKYQTLNSKVENLAIKKGFNDPSDVVKLTSFDFAIDEDGNIDEKIINSTMDKLIKDKPYLASKQQKQFRQGEMPDAEVNEKAIEEKTFYEAMFGIK